MAQPHFEIFDKIFSKLHGLTKYNREHAIALVVRSNNTYIIQQNASCFKAPGLQCEETCDIKRIQTPPSPPPTSTATDTGGSSKNDNSMNQTNAEINITNNIAHHKFLQQNK